MRRRITSAYEQFYFNKYQDLIKALASRHVPIIDIEDGISIAHRELIWAMAHFDPTRGANLITYAYCRMRGILYRMRQQANKLNKVIEMYMDDCANVDCISYVNDIVIDRVDLDDFLDQCRLTENERCALELNVGHGMSLKKIGLTINRSGTMVEKYRNAALSKCRSFASRQELLAKDC